MVEKIGDVQSYFSKDKFYSEYEDVEQALMKAFPDKTELEIQQAVASYMGTVQDKKTSEIDSKDMLNHITKMFNLEISTQTANAIKKEWEDLTNILDVDVSNLALLLKGYSSDGLEKTDRDFLVLLWQILQA